MVTPCFANTSGEEFDANEMACVGVDDGKVTIQVLNKDGTWGTQGFWYGEMTGVDGKVYPAGWYDQMGNDLVGITLIPGQAVWLESKEEGVAIQSSGAVPGVKTMDVAKGFSMVGNSTPSKINADKLSISGSTDGYTTIQVMNEDGAWGTQGFWYNEMTGVDGKVYPAGWYDQMGNDLVDITLTPGQAVWLEAKEEGVKVSIPSGL